MTIVIKIGGAAIEEPGTLHVCAEAVAQLVRQGRRVAIVHGGGKSLSRALEQLGIKSEFVDGLRVTDAATRDVALMVLAGLVNKKLVGAIQAAGVSALGLCGGDGRMFRARKKKLPGAISGLSARSTTWICSGWRRFGIAAECLCWRP